MTIRERIKLCLILSGALTIILFSYITWISNNNVGDSLEIIFMSAESFFSGRMDTKVWRYGRGYPCRDKCEAYASRANGTFSLIFKKYNSHF